MVAAYVSAWVHSCLELVDAGYEAFQQQDIVDLIMDQFVW